MTLEQLHQNVCLFFAEDGKNSPELINIDTNLIGSGMLDSLSIAQFIVYIEDKLAVEIPIGDFEIDSIATVSSIYDNYVLKY